MRRFSSEFLSPLPGLLDRCWFRTPPLKRWAIVECPWRDKPQSNGLNSALRLRRWLTAERLQKVVAQRGVEFESRTQIGGACVAVGSQFAAVGRSLRSLAVLACVVVEFVGRGLGTVRRRGPPTRDPQFNGRLKFRRGF